MTRSDDTFYCTARRYADMPLAKCLTDYTNANAFKIRKSVCYRCPQGHQNRTDFSEWTQPRPRRPV